MIDFNEPQELIGLNVWHVYKPFGANKYEIYDMGKIFEATVVTAKYLGEEITHRIKSLMCKDGKIKIYNNVMEREMFSEKGKAESICDKRNRHIEKHAQLIKLRGRLQ